MRLLLHWFLISAVLLGASRVLPGITVEGVKVAIIVAFILGIVNAIIRPRIQRLTCPVKLATQGLRTAFEPSSLQPLRKGLIGLLTVAINSFLLIFTSMFVPGFAIADLRRALLLSVIISVVGWLFKKHLAHSS
jgi:putative membrane protein